MYPVVEEGTQEGNRPVSGGRREVTVAELAVQAEANHYKRVAHQEQDQDQVREREKHAKKTKRDQDTALKRYVLHGTAPSALRYNDDRPRG